MYTNIIYFIISLEIVHVSHTPQLLSNKSFLTTEVKQGRVFGIFVVMCKRREKIII